MKPHSSLLLLLAFLAILFSHPAAANDITVTRFEANSSATSVLVNPAGTGIMIDAHLQRPNPNTNLSEAYVALYLLPGSPAIGSTPGSSTADGSTPISNFGPSTANASVGTWEINGSDNSKATFRMAKFITLNSTSPGMPPPGSSAARKLYLVLIDPTTQKIFYTSSGIDVLVGDWANPSITGVAPSLLYPLAYMNISGTGFNSAYNVEYLIGGVTTAASPKLSTNELMSVQIPANTPAGQGFVQVTSNGGKSNLYPITISPTPTPTGPPILTSISPTPISEGSTVTITANDAYFLGYSNLSVSFNGILSANVRVGPRYNQLTVTAPNGLASGNVVVGTSLGNSNGLPYTAYQRPNPCDLSDKYSSYICGDQCVAYGATPSRIQGRVIFSSNSEFLAAGVGYTSEDLRHDERVQWESSTDNMNWYAISGETSRNYQPGPSTQTMYYRRKSTHLVYFFFGQDRRDWYTTNTVTITPAAQPPVTAQNTYWVYSGATFTLNFTLGAGSTSSAWSLPALTWRVNGAQGLNGSFAHHVGAATSVNIEVPCDAYGSYEIHANGFGPCGNNYRPITIYVVGPAPGGGEISGLTTTRVDQTYSYSVADVGSNYSWTVPSNWSIDYGQNTSAIDITTGSVAGSGTVAVEYTTTCGTLVRSTKSVTVTAQPQCRGCAPQRATSEQAEAIYPNPAMDEVTVNATGQEAVVTFYDARGKAQKVVQIHPESVQNKVNVRDLPAGIYHIRVVSEGKAILEKQLVIEH